MYGALTGEPFRPLTANISHNANGQNTTNTDQPLVKCKVISSWDQFGWSSPSLQKKTDFSACCFAPVFFSGGKSVCFHRLGCTTFPVHLTKHYILPIQTPTKHTVYSMYSL